VDPRTPWLAIRKPLPPGRAVALKVASFLLPLGLWCVVSYVPFVWHPMVRVTEPGGSKFLKPGALLEREAFAKENARLSQRSLPPASGERANPIFLPAPHEVARAFYTAFTTAPTLKGGLWLHESLWQSIQVIFWAFLISVAIGVPVGLLCGAFDAVSKLVEPVVDFVRYMPPPLFGALAVAVLGIDFGPKVAVIVIGTVFQMVRVIANTARTLDPTLLEAAQTLGARNRGLLTRVLVPGVLPGIYNDLRILLGCAWTLLTVAELFGAMSGISLFINQQGKRFVFPNVFAGIVVIGILGLVTDKALSTLGRFLFPWQQQSQGTLNGGLWGALAFIPRRKPRRVSPSVSDPHPEPAPPNRALADVRTA
jgi:NitT/TauT family transport system permease protein